MKIDVGWRKEGCEERCKFTKDFENSYLFSVTLNCLMVSNNT